MPTPQPISRNTEPLIKTSAGALTVLRGAVKAAAAFGTNGVNKVIQQCPIASGAAKFAGTQIRGFLETPVDSIKTIVDAVKDYNALKELRVLRSHGRLYATGVEKAFGAARGVSGATTAGKLTQSAFVNTLKSGTGGILRGLGKQGVISGVVSMADEAISQFRTGKWDGGKITAKGGTGFLKGMATAAAYAGGVAAAVGVAALAGATAPAWVPVAVGVGAALAVGCALDKLDEKFQLTDNLGKGINAGAKATWNAASSVGKSIGKTVGSWFGKPSPAH